MSSAAGAATYLLYNRAGHPHVEASKGLRKDSLQKSVTAWRQRAMPSKRAAAANFPGTDIPTATLHEHTVGGLVFIELCSIKADMVLIELAYIHN